MQQKKKGNPFAQPSDRHQEEDKQQEENAADELADILNMNTSNSGTDNDQPQQPAKNHVIQQPNHNQDNDSEFPEEEIFSMVSGINIPKTNKITDPNVGNIDTGQLDDKQKEIILTRRKRAQMEPSSLLSESNMNQEDPLTVPDIAEVHKVFNDQDPAVLLDIYNQVGQDKELLIETILNGGMLPEHLRDQMNARISGIGAEQDDAAYLNNLVGGDNQQAQEEILMRQMELMGENQDAAPEDPNAPQTDEQIAQQMQQKEIKRARQMEEQMRIEQHIQGQRQGQVNGQSSGINQQQQNQHQQLGMSPEEYQAAEQAQYNLQIQQMEQREASGVNNNRPQNVKNKKQPNNDGNFMNSVKNFLCCNTTSSQNRNKNQNNRQPQAQPPIPNQGMSDIQ